MDLTQMTQLISNVGFPIACCCVMFYQNSKLQQTLQEITVTMQSLVTKDCLGSNSIIAGNPAKVIKKDIVWKREAPENVIEM